MFTRTAKQILSPLAESVSALIVIISDSEANGTPTPDLSQLSKAVETQLGNMLRIAKEIGGQPGADAELRAAMPGACDEVTNASSLLVSATDELARNPVSPAGRARLLDAVKGILSGTTLMLAALDGSEVRKILAASRVFCGHLSRLCGGVPAAAAAAAVMSHTAPATAPGSAAAAATANAAPPPPKIYIQWVTQASQTLVVLAQLATKRVAEILSDAMQLELQAQIRVLTKESPLLISACKMVLTAPEAEEPVYAMQGICERLRAASARIDEIVQWRGDGVGDEAAAAAGAAPTVKPAAERRLAIASELLAEPLSARLAAKPAETRKLYSEYVAACTENLTQIQEALATVRDPKAAEFAGALAADTRGNIERLEALAVHGYRAPGVSDEAVDAEARALVEGIHANFGSLGTVLSRGLVGEIVVALGTLADPARPGSAIGDLTKAAAIDRDMVAIGLASSAFAKEGRKLDEAVRQALNTQAGGSGVSGDGRGRSGGGSGPGGASAATTQAALEVKMHYDRVVGLRPAVSIAASVVADNPNDAGAQEHLKGVVASYTDAARDLQKTLVSQEGVFPAHDLVFGTKAAFDYHSKALRDALSRSNRVAAREHLAAMQSCAEQFEAIAEKEKEFSEDTAYKAELDLKLQVIKAVTPALSAQAMGLVAQHVRASGSQLQDLDLAIENLAEQLSSLGAAVQAYKGGRPERIAPPVPVPAAEANTPSIAVAPASDGTPRASRTASSGIDEASKQLGTLSVQGRPSQVSEGSGAARSSRTSRVEDEELHALTSAVSETVFVEAPAPQMLSAEEATQFPLRAAGQELKVEASVWATENNAVIEAVTSMSQRMLDLSEFHARLAHSRSDPAAKRSFIQAAQAIMVDANTLLKAAQPLVEACTDRRLRMQLQGTLTYITTLAQQLKIVAAVKASSPLDADKDVQLVSCAQNLMKTVKMGLRDCVACSLRVRKGSEAAAVAGIVKFRKVVYARD